MDRNIDLFWNCMNIPTPVILSIAIKCQNSYEVVDKMKSLMSNIKQTLRDLKQMDIEAAIISRLIYQLKLKLRQEKSLKVLQKINRCLTNYKTIHLSFIISSIEETLDVNFGPSRQMLEWALVRIYGIAHLFHRVNLLCIEAVGHLFVKIKLGQLWNMTLVPIAVCSRLWTFSHFIVRKTCEWYNNLYPYLDKLEASASPWLPQGYVLPRYVNLTPHSQPHLPSDLIQPSDSISDQNSDLIASETSELPRTISIGHGRVADMGVRVSRTSFEEFCVKGRQNSLPLYNMKTDSTDKPKLNQMPSVNSNAKKARNRNKNVNQKTPSTLKDSLDVPQISVDKSYKHSVESIASTYDLEQFIKYESHLHNHKNYKTNGRPLIIKGGKLQWLSIQQFIEEQIRLIKKAEKAGKSEKKEKILQTVKLYIKKRMKS